ncbi:MAG: response regulator [Aquabacterium sp.]|jgi:DNA-binding NarL/FixJ family response regulator|uniref:response regulator n=1 Tax=Aquabacterium sp. TaxID=1872578 RepID=UPI003BB12F1E
MASDRFNLLLVEPHFVLRSTVTSVARSLNLGEIHAAPSREAASQMLMARRFDAFVIAVGPDGEGLKLINAIRAGTGRSPSDAAVVVMAEFCDERAILAFKELKVRRILLKPFKVKDVLETIQALAQLEHQAVAG